MSLHLIESRKVVSRNSRKRDGMLVSVVAHAILIVSSFSLAAASPIADGVRKANKVIYVAPPKSPEAATPRQAARAEPSLAPSPPDVFIPTIVVPVVIPDVIPDINIMHTADLPVKIGTGSRRSISAPGDGSDNEHNIGVRGSSAAFNEAQVDKVVSILSGYRMPRYPEALRAAGVEQTLNTEFVVDTLGRIEPNTLTFGEGAHASFMNAVREALANARFRPAEAGGHRVRQRVTQAFVFSLSKED